MRYTFDALFTFAPVVLFGIYGWDIKWALVWAFANSLHTLFFMSSFGRDLLGKFSGRRAQPNLALVPAHLIVGTITMAIPLVAVYCLAAWLAGTPIQF